MTRAQIIRNIIKTTGTVSMNAFEMFVLAEILWYYLHNGTQTFHGAIAERIRELQARAEHEKQVRDTFRSIQDLPEQ